MRESTWVSLLLLLLLPAPQRGGPQDGRGSPEPEPERGPLQPFDLLYASGVAAYYSGDYEGAVRDLEAALRSHRRLRDIRTRCARHCAARRPLAPPGAGPGAELPFFRAVLERARCSRSCQSQRLGGPASRHRVSEDVRSDFQRRVPYNYLQRAYYQLKKLDLAASAAHTFFVANPTHLQMREDMAKYRRMSAIRPQSFQDLVTPLYWAAYDTGLELLKQQEAALALPKLEEALQGSLAQMESCRAGCEGPEEHQGAEEEEEKGTQGGLYEAIAGHWIRVLQCRQHCVAETATRPGRSFPVRDFLPSQLRRLHEAYAQGQLRKTIA